jgi:hypothetical protein
MTMSDLLTPDLPRGFAPQPTSSRVFVRCYRHYGEAKHAHDQLSVVARIPDKHMTVVARGLDWRETLPTGRLFKLACGLAAVVAAAVGLILWALGYTGAGTGWVAQTVLAAVFGGLAGLALASAVAWLRRPRKGLADTGHVEPRQYDILVEEELAQRAREVLDAD